MRRAFLLALALAGCDSHTPRGDLTFIGRVVDGDTFVDSRGERWRLARIDTPELGPCRPGRDCADGDPHEAKAVLEALLGNVVTCRRVDTDHYGRSIGECYTASGRNISDELLRLGVAERYGR